jgi:hypothetical protein
MAAGEAAAGDGLLTFKFDNKAPVALEDLTASLNALAQSYEGYLVTTGEALPEAGVKLYVHDLRTGSITAVLQAMADQGHLLFGEHGVVPAVQSAFEHADTIGGFIVSPSSTPSGALRPPIRPERKSARLIFCPRPS